MNKKLVLVIALIVALFSISAVSAGFFDFLHFGDDSSDVNVVEMANIVLLMKFLHTSKNFTNFQAII